MKHSRTITAIFVCLVILVLGKNPVAQDKKPLALTSGNWKFTESFTNKSGKHTSVWQFQLVDSGRPTIVALGKRMETDGVKFEYGGGEVIIVIHRLENGTLEGSYLEADHHGNQVEYPVDVSIFDKDDGKKQLYLATVDQDDRIKSTFIGEWSGLEEQKPLKNGKWTVREIVGPENGKYNIIWSYKMSESKGNVFGRGNKIMVNGRKAHPLELKTECEIFLQRQKPNPVIIEGTGSEKSPNAKPFYADYEGWVAPTGDRLVMLSYENEKLAAVLIGKFLK